MSEEITRDSPISRVLLPATYSGHHALIQHSSVRTVGELLDLAERDEIGAVKGIGVVGVMKIKAALAAAGFTFGHEQGGPERDQT